MSKYSEKAASCFSLFLAFVLFQASFLAACSDDDAAFPGLEPGQACTYLYQCRTGVLCSSDGVCVEEGQPGSFGRDHACGSSHDCQMGLVCASSGLCSYPGTGASGDPCQGAEDCGVRLVCAGDGLCREPGDPGTGDVGDECQQGTDCMMGITCFWDGTCRAVQWWSGADCSASDADTDDPRPYFEVPRSGEPLVEFYRLPFPSDIRVHDGTLELSGHPAPVTEVGGDLMARYLDAVMSDFAGFSLNGTFLQRFSRPVQFESIRLEENPSFYMVDITPGSPGYGHGWALSAFVTTGRGKYICNNWISLRPQVGNPLRPGTTYGVILTSDIRALDSEGNPVPMRRDDDFQALMEAYEAQIEPSDPDLAAAYRAFQPLWDALDATSIQPIPDPADEIISASVFTTMASGSIAARTREAVRTDPAVPAALAEQLEVVETSGLFCEISGALPAPSFQEGTRPYTTPEDGGAFVFGENGLPSVQETELVSFTLTVPAQAAMPAEGWPLVIYAHGTGEPSRVFIEDGLSGLLSAVMVDASRVARFAVLGFEGVLGGERSGGSTLSPERLFFNLENPDSALYNTLQGAADLFQVVRMVEGFDHDLDPVGSVRFDPARIFLIGHDQGAITGIVAAAYEPAFKAVVLSGAAGHRISWLLDAESPFETRAVLSTLLAEASLDLDHPMLNLMQIRFDPADPLNYGSFIGRSPLIEVGAKEIFMLFGTEDTFAPKRSQAALAHVMGLDLVGSVLDELNNVGLYEGTYPMSGNASIDGEPYTQILAQYENDGVFDGHFVIRYHPDAASDLTWFLATALLDGTGSFDHP